MSGLDLTEARTAMAQKLREPYSLLDAVLADVAPAIERQVRERVAVDIENLIQGHEPGDCAYNCIRCVSDSAYGLAARTVRAAP
jgi:hypothetical protein